MLDAALPTAQFRPALRAERRGDRRVRSDRRERGRHACMINAAFDRVSGEQAIARLASTPVGAPFRYLVTPNVDHLVRLQQTPSLARLYAQAALTVCDSRVLQALSRADGDAAPTTPGADIAERLFAEVIDPSETVTIIGATSDTIAALVRRYGLKDVRWHEPPMGLKSKPEAIAACAQFVADNPARLVFLCVGSPQQELVAEACALRGDCVGWGLCLGASLDFLAGAVERAPIWMRQTGLEWLHRLASEPARMWRRYLLEGPKIFVLWLTWRRQRGRIEKLARSLQARALMSAEPIART